MNFDIVNEYLVNKTFDTVFILHDINNSRNFIDHAEHFIDRAFYRQDIS